MLYILGVASLKEFTLTLMVGVVAGTYSSICITAPLWLWLRKKIGVKEETAEASKKTAKK
jgi:SecD/SecF fusion protein